MAKTILDDASIVSAVLWIFTHAKLVAEPSGAAALAAVLSGALDRFMHIDGPVVAVVSGGNMAAERLGEFQKAQA